MQQSRDWPTTRSTLLGQLRDTDDAAAWHRFVDLYLPMIYGYARRRGLQDADARNVAQEVLLQVSRAIRSFDYDPDRGRFRHWLGLITHQRIFRLGSREATAVQGLGDGRGDTLVSELPGEVAGEWLDELNAHIYRAARDIVIGECDPLSWQAFALVWECGEMPQDVAAVLGKPVHWVYQAKFRILQRLKTRVIELSAEDPEWGRVRMTGLEGDDQRWACEGGGNRLVAADSEGSGHD